MKDSWSQRYERLRVDGLNNRKSAGLLLLTRQGVLAWMAAWRSLTPQVTVRRIATPVPIDMKAQEPQIVKLMAEMLMAGCLEVSA